MTRSFRVRRLSENPRHDSREIRGPAGSHGVLFCFHASVAENLTFDAALLRQRPAVVRVDTWIAGSGAFEMLINTQGKIEAAICEGISRFEQEYTRRGPKDIHAHPIGDLLVVRLRGVLAAAEQQLVKALPAETGRGLLNQVRTQLMETARSTLEAMVLAITGIKVVSLHHDITTLAAYVDCEDLRVAELHMQAAADIGAKGLRVGAGHYDPAKGGYRETLKRVRGQYAQVAKLA